MESGLLSQMEVLNPCNFIPGNLLLYRLAGHHFVIFANPFSFAGAPSNLPQISFTIKEVGDLTKSFRNMPLNTDIYLFGPYGHMNRDLHKGPPDRGIGSVLIAAGIGVTPMISILRESVLINDNDPIKLLYACRHEKDILYKDELQELAQRPNIDVHIFLSQPTESWNGNKGRIDYEFLKDYLGFEGYQNYLYFVCGRTQFAHNTVKNLERIGDIPMFNILFEDFSIYD